MTLSKNLRVINNDSKFKQWLLNVGAGKRCSSYKQEHELIEISDGIRTKKENIVNEIYGCSIKADDKHLKN